MAANGMRRLPLVAVIMLCLYAEPATFAKAQEGTPSPSASAKASTPQHEAVVAKPKLDRSGKTRRGKGSYYARQFYGKKMADGKRMNPRASVAASKTLPLGTVAKVTNLDTGKSDVVTIEDRGPYIKGRIVDVSPKTAEKIELKEEGVAPVEVKPLVVPKEDVIEKADAAETKSTPK